MPVFSAAQYISDLIIEKEKKALMRWGDGDPFGYIEIAAPEIVYFDPYTDMRVDGLDALRKFLTPLMGKIHNEYFELINPKVQVYGNVAILTYNYISFKKTKNPLWESRWNCTQIFALLDDDWKLIQSHWSRTLADLKLKQVQSPCNAVLSRQH